MDTNGGAISFEIDGHTYTTTLIPAEEGIDLIARLLALVGEPLAALVEGLLRDPAKVAALVKAATDENDATKIDALLGGASLSGMGAALRSGLGSVKAAPLIRDLLKWTIRDGAPLRDPAAFNAAYRGNYAEMFRAVWKVIAVNRLFPLPGI